MGYCSRISDNKHDLSLANLHDSHKIIKDCQALCDADSKCVAFDV